MAVLFLTLCCISYSFQSLFNKYYQLRTDGSANASCWMLLSSSLSVVLCILPFALADFRPEWPVFAVAVGNGLFYALCILITIPAIKLGSLTTFTLFHLTGGIAIPFVYGIVWLHEELTVIKIIGITVILLALLPDVIVYAVRKKGNYTGAPTHKLFFIILCFLDFFANGFATILVKMLFVVSPATNNETFIFFSSMSRVIWIAPLIIIAAQLRRKRAASGDMTFFSSLFSGIGSQTATIAKPQARPIAIAFMNSALYAICNTVGVIFALECAKIMDSSIQFPVVNAARIIGTAAISVVFLHEKLKINNYISVLLALAGIIVFSLA